MKHLAQQFEFNMLTDNNTSTVNLINSIQTLCYESHKNSVLHGFYEGRDFNLGEKMMLIVTELAESFEADRKGKSQLPDEHCPNFTNEEIEAADVFIRLADLSEYRKLRLGAAIVAKMEYNKNRPYKHGKSY